jgi:Putative prokaryotic signal transducing protein
MPHDDDLMVVTTAADEMQQTLIVGRLAEAGIHCVSRGGGLSLRSRSPYDVCVRAADLERARALLKEDEGGFDEDELARLSEEAGRQHRAGP